LETSCFVEAVSSGQQCDTDVSENMVVVVTDVPAAQQTVSVDLSFKDCFTLLWHFPNKTLLFIFSVQIFTTKMKQKTLKHV